jgi:hypothetical protein
MAQLAPLAGDPCYSIKFYKAPADNQEVIPANGYATYGLKITPGSLLYGFMLPCVANLVDPTASLPPAFTVQITDTDLEHKLFTEPVSSLFLANFKPTFIAAGPAPAGSFVHLLRRPYPITGRGVLKIDIQSQSIDVPQRIELILAVLEVCNNG